MAKNVYDDIPLRDIMDYEVASRNTCEIYRQIVNIGGDTEAVYKLKKYGNLNKKLLSAIEYKLDKFIDEHDKK